MPARSKGARLYLRPAIGHERATWIIRDGPKQIRTGCAANEIAQAERKLDEYLGIKHRPSRERGRDPSEIPVADVLSIYLDDRGTKVARPEELKQRLLAVAEFFTGTLADINGALCRAYVKHRGSDSMSRRELEDLRAAINHHRQEGLCNQVVEVVLPAKSQARQRWLTRSEAARLIWAAWRYREVQKGKPTGRHSRQHIARFLLVALYTGTRAGAICGAALQPAIGRGYVDLVNGIFYRKALGAAETKKRQPTVRIPARLLAHMRRWARRGISVNSVIEWLGKPVKSVRKALKAAARAAGLEGVTPHVTRHTSATWAMQNGADKRDAKDFFGMTDETIERYAHHHPDHQKGVADALTRKRRH